MSRWLRVFRHGLTAANSAGVRSGGESRSPLVLEGREQARGLGRRLSCLSPPLEAAFSSELDRALETASLALEDSGVVLETDSAFNERLLGEWNGTPISAHEDSLRGGAANPPGGEEESAFRRRVCGGFSRILNRMASGEFDRAAVFTSSGVIRVFCSEGLGRDGVRCSNCGEISAFLDSSSSFASLRLGVERGLRSSANVVDVSLAHGAERTTEGSQ